MVTENKILKRKMFFAERLMHVDGRSSIMLKLCIMVKGSVEEENLRSALTKLQRKHPQLRMRVEGNYFVFDDNVPPIPLRIVERISDIQWKEEMEADIKTPIDTVNGPMVRIVWLRSPERSEIMIITTHTIMDGVAIVGLMKELMTLLDDPERDVEIYSPILSLKDILPDVKISVWEKLFARCLVPPANLLLYLSTIGKKKKPIQYCELEWTISQEDTAILKRAAKRHNAQPYTLHCILMAKAFMKYHNPERKKRKVFMSLDIRRYIPLIKKDMMFSYAPMLTFDVDFTAQSDYWELTRKFNNELIYKAITDPSVKRAFIKYPIPEGTLFTEEMHGMIKPLVKRNQCVDTGQDFNFINLGLQRYSLKNRTLEADMLRGGNNMPWYNPNLFYITEINGFLSCNLTINTHLISEDKCLKIREEYLRIIQNILLEESEYANN